MIEEARIVAILVVIGFMAYAAGRFIWDQVRLRRSIKAGKPASKYNKYSGQSRSSSTAPSLSKKITKEGEIMSGTATLVAWSDSSRDEFLGLIDVLDGHHTGQAATDRRNRTPEVIKSWQFLGFGDRFDARNRQRDFDRLKGVFRSETQSVLAEYRSQGWRVETISPDVYHLSR